MVPVFQGPVSDYYISPDELWGFGQRTSECLEHLCLLPPSIMQCLLPCHKSALPQQACDYPQCRIPIYHGAFITNALHRTRSVPR